MYSVQDIETVADYMVNIVPELKMAESTGSEMSFYETRCFVAMKEIKEMHSKEKNLRVSKAVARLMIMGYLMTRQELVTELLHVARMHKFGL